MELVKKTTILFSADLHKRLVRVARQRKTSLGALVRDACEIQYGNLSSADRLLAVEKLGKLVLPIGTPREMKLQSVPKAEELQP